MQLTEKAATKIKELAESEGLSLIVRVKILGAGCAGFSHDMTFDDMISDVDEVIEFGEVKIITDPISAQYFEDTTIDYIDSDFSGGFKFLNENIKGTCGCGKSVQY